MEAEIVAARIAACFAVFVTTPDARAASRANSNADRVQEVEPGMFQYLQPGESVETANPGRPNANADAFIVRILRMICAALGLPYEVVAKDFSQTNFSSARAALLEARKMWGELQDWLAGSVCQTSWELALEEAYLGGLWDVPDFYAQRRAWTRATHTAPGWQWVDPVKEVKASKDAVDANLSTLAEECAAQGRDWEDVLKQRKREQDRMDELGIRPPAGTTTTGATPGPADPMDDGNDGNDENDVVPTTQRRAA
jgi:lambda family phage portal protein